MPRFGLFLSIASEKKRDDGLAVSLEITLGLKHRLELPENSPVVHKKLHRAKICILTVTNDEVRSFGTQIRKGAPIDYRTLQEYISWDNMSLKKLLAFDKQEFKFKKHCMLYRPSQKIEVYVTCLSIGEIGCRRMRNQVVYTFGPACSRTRLSRNDFSLPGSSSVQDVLGHREKSEAYI